MGKKLKYVNRLIRLPLTRYFAYNKLDRFHAKERSIDEIVLNAMNLQTSGFFHVSSVQKKSEITRLAKKVQSIKPRIILEIGTCKGGTLFIWSQLASEKVITCDLFGNEYKSKFHESFPPRNSNCQVISLLGNSHSEEFRNRVIELLEGKQVDFLFIDGDHSEKGIEADFNDYSPLVRPGGLIAFHDIVEKQPIPENQVYYFWKRVKNNYEYEEFIDNPEQCGFGIGVIKLPD